MRVVTLHQRRVQAAAQEIYKMRRIPRWGNGAAELFELPVSKVPSLITHHEALHPRSRRTDRSSGGITQREESRACAVRKYLMYTQWNRICH